MGRRILYKKDIIGDFILTRDRQGRVVRIYLVRSSTGPNIGNFYQSSRLIRLINPYVGQSQEQFNRMYNFAAYYGSNVDFIVQSTGVGGSPNCFGSSSCPNSCCINSSTCGCINYNSPTLCSYCN